MVTIAGTTIRWKEGMTVAAALQALDDGGHYAVVRLNGKLVSLPNFHRTPVPDGSRIDPIPMVAGG